MTTSFPFTVHRYLFAIHYPFSVFHEASRLMANSKHTVNSQWLTVNGATGGSV